ncbi:MAG: class I SAM-dependent methyltransferase [Saprospiraceae bacterium]
MGQLLISIDRIGPDFRNLCELVGIDPWEEALKRAQWKIEKQGLT